MKIYTPEQFPALRKFVDCLGLTLSLAHRPFVDYYYASGDWCKLYLNLEEDGTITATYGLERLRFEYCGREMQLGFGSNTYSTKSGAGLYLFAYADESCPVRLVHGGSPDTHKIIRSLGWTYFSGVKTYMLNNPYSAYPNDNWFRIAAKAAARKLARSTLAAYDSRISPEVRQRISVREEQSFENDLLPSHSPFTFRMIPSVEYLNWRYNTQLPFVRYRLFRILENGHTVGYVFINESPKRLIVAQSDGTDPRSLAYGVLLSILHVGREDRERRSVILTSSHPVMQKIYAEFGFRSESEDRPFYIGTPTGPADIAPDTSKWLINFDWGDNGLRSPFLDETAKNDNP